MTWLTVPSIAVHGRHHALEHRIEEVPGLLRIAVGEQLHGAFEVGEQHSDLFALAFQGAAGGQDLLGEIGRGVGEWSLRGWMHGGGRGGRRRGPRADPEQDTAGLIDRGVGPQMSSSLSASRCSASSWNCHWRVR